MSKVYVSLFLMAFTLQSYALASPAAKSVSNAKNGLETNGTEPVVELSFGHSQLFNESKYAAVQQVGVGGIVPTTSVLFIAEWLVAPRWGSLAVFNLPLTTQQTVNDAGDVFQERVAPSVALGGRYSILHFDLKPRALVELQGTILVGRTIGSIEGDFFFPMVGGRIHIARPSGFAMYLGSTWAFHKDTLALFYGAAHRF